MKEKNDKCVVVNIFAKCEKEKKDYRYDKKPSEGKNCVTVNVYVKCENGQWKKEEHGKDESCVEVNIYAECEEEKEYKNCDC